MAVDNSAKVAHQLIQILLGDLPKLRLLDDYLKGRHVGPYVPENADAEYRLLAHRCVTNWQPLLVRTPAQAMYVDGFNYGNAKEAGQSEEDPAWEHWQLSNLDGRQGAFYEGAFALGHAFTVTERSERPRHEGKSITRMMSALNTTAVFRDPVNDIIPIAALHVEAWPWEYEPGKWKMGKAYMWDDELKYEVSFNLADPERRRLTVTELGKHGASECPVTRFAASVDLEGRTVGIIEPMIPVQDRINQTVFDLLMVQTNGSFNIRWVTGMAPPLKKTVVYVKDPTTGETVFDADGQPIIEDIVDTLDESGRPIPEDVQLSTKRFLFAEDPDAKFGSLEGTALEGYINSIDMSIRHLAMLSQTPPTHMMGSIVNLSAEAMQSAEVALTRKVQAFKTAFGECWERVINLAAEIDGSHEVDDKLETQWRDMEGQSFAKTADALLKLKEIGVPQSGLWGRIPGVTATELEDWKSIAENDPAQVLASGLMQVRGQTPNSSPETMANVDPDLE